MTNRWYKEVLVTASKQKHKVQPRRRLQTTRPLTSMQWALQTAMIAVKIAIIIVAVVTSVVHQTYQNVHNKHEE